MRAADKGGATHLVIVANRRPQMPLIEKAASCEEAKRPQGWKLILLFSHFLEMRCGGGFKIASPPFEYETKLALLNCNWSEIHYKSSRERRSEVMDDKFRREQIERCRRLAKEADPFTQKRLLKLADEYEEKLGIEKPSQR